jgi:hypothetical protein
MADSEAMARPVLILLLVPLGLLLAGCDQLGIESASQIAAQREAEGKAIGGACRNAGRAIEDCYALNRKADKAAVYAGWREMNDYMRENKMDAVPPQLTPAPATDVARAASSPSADEAPAEEAPKKGKSADKGADKGGDKTDKSGGKKAEAEGSAQPAAEGRS